MSITFEPLKGVLKKKGLKLNYLRTPKDKGGLGISSCTVNKISHDQPVSFEILDTICREMRLPIGKVIQYNDGPFKRAPLKKRDYPRKGTLGE